jgi:hypothetical protein
MRWLEPAATITTPMGSEFFASFFNFPYTPIEMSLA